MNLNEGVQINIGRAQTNLARGTATGADQGFQVRGGQIYQYGLNNIYSHQSRSKNCCKPEVSSLLFFFK